MRDQSGQTLLETLLALSVSVFILGAITAVVISSLNSGQFTKNHNLANQYAQEGIEVVRKIRDSNWAEFLGLNNTNYCLPQSQTVLTARTGPNCSPSPNVGLFLREIEIIHDSGECPDPGTTDGSKVISKTSWTDGKCPTTGSNIYCHKVELITCFHNVNKKSAP